MDLKQVDFVCKKMEHARMLFH